jgi:5-methylcytosine-specific restriction enzyme B
MPLPPLGSGIERDPRLPAIPSARDTGEIFPAYAQVLQQHGLEREAVVVEDAFRHVQAGRRGAGWRTGPTLAGLIIDYRQHGDEVAATVLSDMLAQMMPQNYTRLTDPDLIERLRATAPNPAGSGVLTSRSSRGTTDRSRRDDPSGGDSLTSRQDFLGLMTALAASGLSFPAELVSNYLLALQAKRFVILTGLSGTGKTQLALAIARAFQPRIRLAALTHVPAEAVVRRVVPYMLTLHKMTLPASIRDDLLMIDPSNERKDSRRDSRIEVSYPGGHAHLTLGRYTNSSVFVLFFSGAFRAWFDATLKEDDQFLIQLEFEADSPLARLRISLPDTEVREEILDTFRVVAVRPDWTDNRALLGYYNPLLGRYETTPTLDLILRAHADLITAQRDGRSPHPFFLILDEMNLAHVEHYLSDFLSSLESGQPIDLHGDTRVEGGETEDETVIPARLTIPSNLFLTGTVNVDETTYMFSPKVLDRAFTIEFNEVNLTDYCGETNIGDVIDATPISLHHFHGLTGTYRPPSRQDWREFARLSPELHQIVLSLHALLAAEGRHFGYRVANEIARFVMLAHGQGEPGESTWRTALDLALLQKVLPKLHGTQQELEGILTALFSFAVATTPSTDDALHGWLIRGGRLAPDARSGRTAMPLLPRTAAKLWRMIRRLRQQGFTSFIE